MSPLVRTIRDLRASLAGIASVVLTLAACVAVLVPLIRGDGQMVDKALAVAGLLLSNAGSLLADPGRHGRATDPG